MTSPANAAPGPVENTSEDRALPWAWCYEPVGDPVCWHSVPFHARCWERRAAVLEPSPEALPDFVVDHLGPAAEYHQAPC